MMQGELQNKNDCTQYPDTNSPSCICPQNNNNSLHPNLKQIIKKLIKQITPTITAGIIGTIIITTINIKAAELIAVFILLTGFFITIIMSVYEDITNYT